VSEKNKILTLSGIENTVIKQEGECVHCGRKIKKGSIQCYEHNGGIHVKDFEKKQWVYFHCYWCQIDSSIDKVLRKLKSEKKL